MSEYQGIEPPTRPRYTDGRAPYDRGDRIYDRVAVNGASYEVIDCLPIGPALAAATRASWQVIFLLPTGHLHYVWVDDTGSTPAAIYGPEPPGVDLEQLLAAYTYVRPGGRP